ncbi:unnamed protein product [Blepharisma stoltei]|uniref:Uncharacterized protein n=1 Tax=Blepharisma stoltei TaxID=1481888 RepID=A0AAU9KAD8_9CILI|nr:unnamed protein product [Blepharisma stoltei]
MRFLKELEIYKFAICNAEVEELKKLPIRQLLYTNSMSQFLGVCKRDEYIIMRTEEGDVQTWKKRQMIMMKAPSAKRIRLDRRTMLFKAKVVNAKKGSLMQKISKIKYENELGWESRCGALWRAMVWELCRAGTDELGIMEKVLQMT